MVAKEVAGTDNPFAIDTLLFSLFNNERNTVVEKGSYEYIVLNAYIMALLKKNEEIRKKRQTIEEVLSVTARIVSGISIIASDSTPWFSFSHF